MMDELATDVGTLVESLFGEVAERGEKRTPKMSIPMDIDESSSAYTVTLDVPGVSLDAIEIEIHEDTLSISGARGAAETPVDSAERASTEAEPQSPSQKVTTARRRERLFGKFGRTIRLPHPVEQDDVSASLNDGVLVITLPKADPDKGKRRIPVSRG